MKKTVGQVVVIDTNPPYREWDGNQATYLFFPVFASLILTLIGTLSAPLIPGLSTVDVHSIYGDGVVKLGAWGMCIQNFPHEVSKCIPYSIFGNNTAVLAELPTGILAMGINPSPVDDSYKIANAIMHVLACVVSWMAVTWTLAASGEFHAKGKFAWNWTRWAWWGNTVTLIVGIVPFALDIALIPKTAAIIKFADGSHGKVYPGATIYMSAAATTLNLVTLFVRYLWSRRQPRPSWMAGDFHVNPMPPAPGAARAEGSLSSQGMDMGMNSDAVEMPYPHFGNDSKAEPPTWESLNIDSAIRPTEKDQQWSRADGALESIEEKRASLVKDGYSV